MFHKSPYNFVQCESQSFHETRKSFCVNARGIPSATKQVLTMLLCLMGGGTPSSPDQGGTPSSPSRGVSHPILVGVPHPVLVGGVSHHIVLVGPGMGYPPPNRGVDWHTNWKYYLPSDAVITRMVSWLNIRPHKIYLGTVANDWKI